MMQFQDSLHPYPATIRIHIRIFAHIQTTLVYTSFPSPSIFVGFLTEYARVQCFLRAAPLLSMGPCKTKLNEKVKTCGLCSEKWFWPSILAQDAEAGKRRRCGKRHIKRYHLLLMG
jgi:hypothetical protein